MKCVCETNPVWVKDKQRIIGGAPQGCFNLCNPQLGGALPYRWWRLETASSEILGYGWLDDSKGEAEISVVACVKGKGYGTKILHNLEKEAKKLGCNHIVAVVQPENPCAKDVINWLFKNKTGTTRTVSPRQARKCFLKR